MFVSNRYAAIRAARGDMLFSEPPDACIQAISSSLRGSRPYVAIQAIRSYRRKMFVSARNAARSKPPNAPIEAISCSFRGSRRQMFVSTRSAAIRAARGDMKTKKNRKIKKNRPKIFIKKSIFFFEKNQKYFSNFMLRCDPI